MLTCMVKNRATTSRPVLTICPCRRSQSCRGQAPPAAASSALLLLLAVPAQVQPLPLLLLLHSPRLRGSVRALHLLLLTH
jgi:hypothetical protein